MGKGGLPAMNLLELPSLEVTVPQRKASAADEMKQGGSFSKLNIRYRSVQAIVLKIKQSSLDKKVNISLNKFPEVSKDMMSTVKN